MRIFHKKEGNNIYSFIPSRFEPFLLSRSAKKRQRIISNNKKRLTNESFSIIADCCIGGQISHELGQKQRSPFVNISIDNKNYLKLLKNLRTYLNDYKLCDVTTEDSTYITGRLENSYDKVGPVINFVHYSSFSEAQEAWERRKIRVNYYDLRIIVSDGLVSGKHLTLDEMNAFLELPYDKILFFTNDFNKRNVDDERVVFLEKYQNQKMLYPGNLELFGGHRVFERYIDFVQWLNN